MSLVEASVRNLSVRHRKEIRERLWNPPNAVESSELEIISNERAEARRREQEARARDGEKAARALQRLKKLEAFEAERLQMARKKRALELLAEFHRAVDAWIIESGAEPLTPFLPRLKCTEIIAATAEHFGIAEIDMVSARRTQDVLYPRMVAMYIARKHTACSLPMIGQRFGGRDHTTVLHTIHKAEKKLNDSDAQFAANVAAIKQKLGVE